MPKPNYRFDKRQRELKKTQQQEEKRLKKLARAAAEQQGDESPVAESSPSEPTGPQS
jgi:hypothetical protein